MNNRHNPSGHAALDYALDHWHEAVIYGEPDGTIGLDDLTGHWSERLYPDSLVLVKVGNKGHNDPPAHWPK